MEALVIGAVVAIVAGFLVYFWATGAEQAKLHVGGTLGASDSLVPRASDAPLRPQPGWVVRVPPTMGLDWWMSRQQIGGPTARSFVVVFADPADDEELVSIYPWGSPRAMRAIAAHVRGWRSSTTTAGVGPLVPSGRGPSRSRKDAWSTTQTGEGSPTTRSSSRFGRTRWEWA